MNQKQRKNSSASISTIETEYMRSLQKKAQRKNIRKARLYKRLAVFAVVVILSIAGLTHTFIKQKQVLALKEQQKIEATAHLKEVQEEQEVLKRQLVKLNDDNYIAKLARKEYFLSDKSEIIFSIPENKKKTDKKDDRKE